LGLPSRKTAGARGIGGIYEELWRGPCRWAGFPTVVPPRPPPPLRPAHTAGWEMKSLAPHLRLGWPPATPRPFHLAVPPPPWPLRPRGGPALAGPSMAPPRPTSFFVFSLSPEAKKSLAPTAETRTPPHTWENAAAALAPGSYLSVGGLKLSPRNAVQFGAPLTYFSAPNNMGPASRGPQAPRGRRAGRPFRPSAAAFYLGPDRPVLPPGRKESRGGVLASTCAISPNVVKAGRPLYRPPPLKKKHPTLHGPPPADSPLHRPGKKAAGPPCDVR